MKDWHHHGRNEVADAIYYGLSNVAVAIASLQKPCGKQEPGLWLFQTGHDEPMEKVTETMEVTLSKPIAPGFRRSFTVGMDEAVDTQPDGSFAKSEMVTGDSTAPTISPTSTNKQLNGFVNGDGTIGSKQARITCDGHVGEGEVSFELLINYEVASPDATAFVNFKEGTDEAIPAPTP